MVENTLSLVPLKVITSSEAERVRVLRNECRAYMTRHQAGIGPEEQQVWFRSLDRGNSRLYLYGAQGSDNGIGWLKYDVGYGFCRLIADKWWLSGGLTATWQGKGLGKKLFGHLMAVVGKPCWLEALEHNTRAINTYTGIGFREVTRDSGIVTMVAE